MMHEAIRECLVEERDFIFLHTLDADCARFSYRVGELIDLFLKSVGMRRYDD